MKVFFTIDSLSQGGTEQSIADLIGHFNSDMEVIVVYFYNAHHLKPLYDKLNCKIYYLDINEKYGFYNAITKFKKLIAIEVPDIVVSSLYRSLIISRLVCWWTNTPLIGTFVNESYTKERRSYFKGISIVKYYLTWILDRLTSFIPKKIISNSYSISLLNGKSLGINTKKITVIYRGRDTQIIEKWSNPVKNDKFIWMAVGRLIPQKGYEILLQAFHLLISRYPMAELRIIGEGPLRLKLKALINQYQLENNVFLEGNIPLGWKRLYSAHAFVLPSVSEGFSGSLVEALMIGIPIVASDIPMNIEAISPGKYAYFFRKEDWRDLYNKMTGLMNNYHKACEIGKIMRLRAIDNYDIRNIAITYSKTIKSVVNGHKS